MTQLISLTNAFFMIVILQVLDRLQKKMSSVSDAAVAKVIREEFNVTGSDGGNAP